MSRSHKYRPFHGITTAESEKEDKVIAHGRLRAAERLAEQLAMLEPEDVIFPLLEEVSNEYSFEKDGKIRFNPNHHPDLMRK